MRALVVCSLILLVGAATYFVYPREELSFRPSEGDVRYFNVAERVEYWDGEKRLAPLSKLVMNSLLRTDVEVPEDGGSEIRSRALRTRFFWHGRELFNTNGGVAYGAGANAMEGLATSGVVQRVSESGRLVQSTYADPRLASILRSERSDEDVARKMLHRGLSISAPYLVDLAGSKPHTGASWTTPPQQVAGVTMPELRYEVSYVDEDSVTLKFRTREGDAEGARSVEGYLELERHSGWPLRAGATFTEDAELDGEPVTQISRITLEQTGITPVTHLDRIRFNAERAMSSYELKTDTELFQNYFLPPFGQHTPQESLAWLDRTLLWFGPAQSGEKYGLNYQSHGLDLSSAEFHAPMAVRLLDEEGKPVSEEVQVNPWFLSSAWNESLLSTGSGLRPFLSDGLTREQLELVDRVEVDLSVTAPDTLYTLTLNRGDTEHHVAEAGVTLTVDSWSHDRALVRMSRDEGFLPQDQPLVSVVPLDRNGEPVAAFTPRTSHSLVEPLREALLKDYDYASPSLLSEPFADQVATEILAKPLRERRGEMLYEISVPGGSSFHALTVYLHSTRTEARTLVARKADATLSGGVVIGERFLNRKHLSDLPYVSLHPDDVSMRGLATNWLSVGLPDGLTDRCELSVAGAPEYQSSPLDFSYQSYGERQGSLLTTRHGVSFFYDFAVDVLVDCVTEVEMKTSAPGSDPEVRWLDDNTVEVSEALHQNLEWARRGFGLRSELPFMAFSKDGLALEPLTDGVYGHFSMDDQPVGRRFRFWGDVAEVRYPARVHRESIQLPVQFPPLP